MISAVEKLLSKVKRPSRRAPCLGVDAGNRSVKALGARFGESLDVRHWFELSRPESGAGMDGVSGPFREKVSGHGLEGALGAFALPDEQVESHQFRLPKLPESELQTAIEWEIKKAVPSAAAVFHDIMKSETSQGIDVSCWLASRELVRGRFEEAVAVGLKPDSLEAESSALAALCGYLHPGTPLHRWVILDLGHVAYRMAFLEAGKVSFTRSLYFGLSTLHGQIGTELGSDALDGERLTRETISDEEKRKLVERLMQESLYNLCEEFRRSEYFAKEQKGLEEVETIALVGGGACWAPAVEYLKRHLSEKKVTVLDPFSRAPELPEGLARGQGPAWACAAGLALRGAET